MSCAPFSYDGILKKNSQNERKSIWNQGKNKIVVDFNKHHHYTSNNVIHQMSISIFDISGAHLKRVRFKCQIQRTKRGNKYRKLKKKMI
jgi:hypothetical protein